MSDFSYTQPYANCSPMTHSLMKRYNIFVHIRYFPSKRIYRTFADGHKNHPTINFPNIGNPEKTYKDMEKYYGEEILLGNIVP